MVRIVLTVGSFVLGAIAYAWFADRAIASRDRLLEDYYVTAQALAADSALKRGDAEAAIRYQRAALEALTSKSSAIGTDVHVWSVMYPFASEVLKEMVSPEQNAKARRFEEAAYRERLALLLEKSGKADEAASERATAARLKGSQ